MIPECGFDDDVLDLVPTVRESREIDEILAMDNKFESVSQVLQRSSTHEKYVDLHGVRCLFDGLIEECPAAKPFLKMDAEIVHSKHFESGVIKVQSGNEQTLTRDEKKSLKRFLIDYDANNDSDIEEIESDQLSFADSVLERAQAAKRQRIEKSAYRSMKHVSPTSNVCERLFSRAKLIMTDQRKHMTPYHLEMMLFLRFNSDLWNIAILDDIIKKGEVNLTPAEENTLETLSVDDF